MVDIDTSGPEVEVNLEEQKKVEEPKETIEVEEISEKETDKTYENEKEEHGYVYVQKGWLWFSWTYAIPFGWENVKSSEPPLESDYDGMGNFSRFGNPPKNT